MSRENLPFFCNLTLVFFVVTRSYRLGHFICACVTCLSSCTVSKCTYCLPESAESTNNDICAGRDQLTWCSSCVVTCCAVLWRSL